MQRDLAAGPAPRSHTHTPTTDHHTQRLPPPTIDVVEACDAALDAKVLVVVHAQLLSGQLLQAVRVLWGVGSREGGREGGRRSAGCACMHALRGHASRGPHRNSHQLPQLHLALHPCNHSAPHHTQPAQPSPPAHLRLCGPGVCLLEAAPLHLCAQLLVLGVDAGGGGVEEALHARLPRRLHHVEAGGEGGGGWGVGGGRGWMSKAGGGRQGAARVAQGHRLHAPTFSLTPAQAPP